MNFHEKIRLLRKEKGLTQDQVANKTGIAISSIRNYEKDRLPDSQQLKRIKDFYKVPYEYLLNDECNTREEENLKIGEKLGISDKSIAILQKLSSGNKAYILEQLLDYIYNKNSLEKIDEYINVNYIVDTIFNSICPKIEKLLKDKKYNNITDEQLRGLEFFINYNLDLNGKTNRIKEREYLIYLLRDSYYEKFIATLTYITQSFDCGLTISEYDITNFNEYKKIKEIFENYKLYLLNNILIHIDNDFFKELKQKKLK